MPRLYYLSKDLNRYTGDLDGSICLVGYTANTWLSKERGRLLSFNVQWVAVLADSEDVEENGENEDEESN
jgi:hypothetical protein